jgi:mRNA interferase YafQ
MRVIERSSAFKRDFKRELAGRHKAALQIELVDVLTALVEDRPLNEKHRDHELVGDWMGYRECHIRPDLLLIYRKSESGTLRLARMGSHSELFG